MSVELARLSLVREDDVFSLRQVGREAGELLGLERQHQVRLATALSEVGRELLAVGRVSVTLTVEAVPGPPRLVVTLVSTGRLAAPGGGPGRGEVSGTAAAQRLLDAAEVYDVDAGTGVRLTKVLGPAAAGDLQHVRRTLAQRGRTSASDELRAQNADLVRALEDLTARSAELATANEALADANDELEETNRGVVAMYTQLTNELEETNSGVVALYAELDERGRQLAAANEAKTRLLRNVSHELRGPVNSILGLVSLIGETSLDAEQRVQVGYLDGSARSLLTLVNELLDLSRAESGHQEVVRGTVDLPALLADLRGSLAPLARPGVELVVPPSPVATVETDPDLLERILRNLVTNALKFTADGHVRVEVTHDGTELAVTVEDTGIGLEPEDVPRVFEEFYQVPNPLQAGVQGTGLGLPYARRTAESLGGTLSATSTPGTGSAFRLVLPAAAPVGPEAALARSGAAPHGSDPAAGPGRVGHVLVVDDDPSFRGVVRSLLTGLAEHVTEAGGGHEALERLRADRPDVALVDLRMPAMDGAQLVREVRADAALATVPVVLMSSVEELPGGDVAGLVQGFLPKAGLDRELLRAALRSAHGGAGS
ncbi:ATP-binding response regulator [Cellulomonas sp. NPDC055163]